MVRTKVLTASAYGCNERVKLCIRPTTATNDSNDPEQRIPLDVHVGAASRGFGELDDCSVRWEQPNLSFAGSNSLLRYIPRVETSFLRSRDQYVYDLSDTRDTGVDGSASRFFQIQEMTDVGGPTSNLGVTHGDGPYARIGFILDPQEETSSAPCSGHFGCTPLTAKALIVSDLYRASLIGRVNFEAPSTQTPSNYQTAAADSSISGQETGGGRGGQEQEEPEVASSRVTNLPFR